MATLVTFVFVITGFVYATFAGRTEDLHGYIDALYFTVTSVTTTGFGDVTLPGTWGKLLTIVDHDQRHHPVRAPGPGAVPARQGPLRCPAAACSATTWTPSTARPAASC